METHSQHLHKAPGNKFWHYFFEFFMLFLAVFCGFLVENFREHQIEKERGVQYIESFYEDLKSDTFKLSGIIAFDDIKLSGLKNIDVCFDGITENFKETSCLEELIFYSRWNITFQLTDKTIRQLANAGGYRLLMKEDADSIMNYESKFKAVNVPITR